MTYHIMIYFHNSQVFYGNSRIYIYIFLLKRNITKKISTIKNVIKHIIHTYDSNFSIKYNIKATTLLTFFNNKLVLLKMFYGCGVIELCKIVFTQMAECCGALQTRPLF